MNIIMLMTNKKRLTIFFSLLIFSVPFFGFLLSTKVYAAATGKWITDSKIEVSGAGSGYDGTYVNRSEDNSSAFILDGDSGYCVKEDQHLFNKDDTDKLYRSDHVIRDINDAKTSANYNRYEAVAVSSTQGELSKDDFENMSESQLGTISVTRCIRRAGPTSMTLTEVDQATIEYTWLDEANIERTDGDRLYVKDGSKFIWTEDDNSCKEYLTTSSTTNGTRHYDGDKKVNGECTYKTEAIALGSPSNASKPAGTGVTKDGTTTGDVANAVDEEPSCESGGGELSFLLCPALRLTSSFIAFVDEKLNELLKLPSSYYENREVELAWSRMRNIAYAILIPVMLIMILATALGFDFVSAYTFKKAMPRLAVAVLFIALSLEITQFLVILTNDVGQGILGLITSAFNGAEDITLASLFDPNGATGGLFTGGAIIGSVIVVGGLIPVLLLFLLSAGLSLLIALLALAFRQMLLVSFMIIAPLAILAWIFPGNDKLWKLWWNAFSKLLILFPLIMFLIGAGRGFASMVQSSGPDDFLATVLKLSAYVLPYFFIPAMFKFAGGIFATITGMTNDRSKGVFDRLRNARKKSAEGALHRARDMNYFKGASEKGLRAGLNKAITGATLLPESGLRPKRFADNMQAARDRREVAESEEFMKSVEGRQLQDDDHVAGILAAEAAGGDEAAYRAAYQDRAYKRTGHYVDEDTMDKSVAAWKRARRTHSVGALKLAAIRSGMNSSTMWNNEMEFEYEGGGSGTVEDARKNGKKIVTNSDGTLKVAKWTQEDFEAKRCKEAMIGTDKVASYTASGDMLRDINMVAGSNRMLSTQLLAEARSGQSRAGREDTGGGGFSDTAVEMDKLWRGDVVEIKDADGNVTGTRKYNVQDATKGVTKSLIKGKNVYEIFRSGKPKVAQAVAPVLAEMTEEDLKGAINVANQQTAAVEATYQQEVQAARVELQTVQNDSQLPLEERNGRVQQINARIQQIEQNRTSGIQATQKQQTEVALRTIAREQMFHSVAATSSPDVAQTMGNQLFNRPFDMNLLPEEIRQHVIQKSGKAKPTHLEVFESLRDHPVWGAYVKEYGRGPIPRLDPNDPNVQAEAARVGMEVSAYIARAEAAAREDAEKRASQAGDPRAR